jgi:Animal haem peroxidase
MFPDLEAAPLDDDTIDALLTAMRRRIGAENPRMPSGYTYLGQFVDHDITFDPTSKLDGDNDPEAVRNFRTPRFDLDSLYGSGPKDQPFLYDWSTDEYPGVKLLVGCSSGDGALTLDLPRNQQGRALIGDGRNDENVIIAQLHLLFIRFHNRVVDRIRDEEPALRPDDLFDRAQQRVRWHYQWIVVHDYLRRIVGARRAAAAKPADRIYRWEGKPFMPVEFSGAAYRFGHSMVRGDYTPNEHVRRAVPIFAKRDNPGELEHLGGFRRLPPALTIDWSFFYDMGDHEPDDPLRPQKSRRIDTNFAAGLFNLPANIGSRRELPRLNLLRGRALRLPSGSAVAHAMGLKPLEDGQLLENVPASARDAVLRAPPLWYYVLCEAQSELGDRGRHLGPVGGRIVAEVLRGLLEADESSYVHRRPAWMPDLPGSADGDFTMPDLVRFALGEPAADPLPARG